MHWLVIVPIINVGIWLICALVSIFTSSSHGSSHGVEVHMPDGEEYKNTHQTPREPNPTIAEQFDGRLTNIVRNPWEGIL